MAIEIDLANLHSPSCLRGDANHDLPQLFAGTGKCVDSDLQHLVHRTAILNSAKNAFPELESEKA